MLYYCAYTWYPGTTQQQVAQRFVQQEEAGLHHPERWRGWYALAGGGAGFLLVETEDPRELTEMLQPYMDLMSWDVRAIYPLDHDQTMQAMREVLQRSA
jgi:hypothetical protein